MLQQEIALIYTDSDKTFKLKFNKIVIDGFREDDPEYRKQFINCIESLFQETLKYLKNGGEKL